MVRQHVLLGLLALALIGVDGGCAGSGHRRAAELPRARPGRMDPLARTPATEPGTAQEPAEIVPAQATAPQLTATSQPSPLSGQPAATVTPASQPPATEPILNLEAKTEAAPGISSPATKVRPQDSSPPAPSPPAVGATPAVALRRLHTRAAERYACVNTYIARLRRHEQVNGKDQPDEVIKFMFRRQPWSVHLKWVGPEGNGREVVYVKGCFESKIHTLLAPTDPRLPFGGPIMALPLDSMLIRARSRHPITEAGVGSLIDRFGQLLQLQERGPSNMLQYAGPQKRPEYEAPLEAVVQEVPPNFEEAMPKGGRRWWFFDAASGFPVLIIAHDATGHEVEYYCYDMFMLDAALLEQDFDPTRLGKDKPRKAEERTTRSRD